MLTIVKNRSIINISYRQLELRNLMNRKFRHFVEISKLRMKRKLIGIACKRE